MTTEVFSTGSIIPLGDGLTGKTLLSKLLISFQKIKENESYKEQLITSTRKSMNIELEFSHATVELDGEIIHTSQQYYVFPGQRLKDTTDTVTFDEILQIFAFFPGIKRIEVLLLVYDTSRFMTLKSLETWLKFALTQGWIYENTRLILVSNKIDLTPPNDTYIQALLDGIRRQVEFFGVRLRDEQLLSIKTSCITLEGIEELNKAIITWIAKYGKRTIRNRT